MKPLRFTLFRPVRQRVLGSSVTLVAGLFLSLWLSTLDPRPSTLSAQQMAPSSYSNYVVVATQSTNATANTLLITNSTVQRVFLNFICTNALHVAFNQAATTNHPILPANTPFVIEWPIAITVPIGLRSTTTTTPSVNVWEAFR